MHAYLFALKATLRAGTILIVGCIMLFLSHASMAAGNYKFQLLPGLSSEFSDSLGSDINDLGEVIGISAGPDAPFTRATSWLHGIPVDLSGGGSFQTVATGINNSGNIVGYRGYQDDIGNDSIRAMLWGQGRQGTMLPGIGLSGDSVASKINSKGEVAGFQSQTGGLPRATRWSNGTVETLQSLSGAPDYSYGRAINSAGQVAGSVVTQRFIGHAGVWTDGIPKDLTSNRLLSSDAYGVNDLEQVVGYIGYVGASRATLWRDNDVIELDNFGMDYSY